MAFLFILLAILVILANLLILLRTAKMPLPLRRSKPNPASAAKRPPAADRD